MPKALSLWIDGKAVSVPAGISVAAALLNQYQGGQRRSLHGEVRGPVCGMGTCFECRVTIDQRPHQLACQVLCREGMKITTHRSTKAPVEGIKHA